MRHSIRMVVWVATTTVCTPVMAQTPTLAPANPLSYARTTAFTYYSPADGAKNGLLRTEVIEPDVPGACVVVTHDYDGQGNRLTSTTANCAGASGRAQFASRTSTQGYTGVGAQPVVINGVSTNVQVSNGAFVTSKTNPLLHNETFALDPRFGTPLKYTDSNALVTETQVDDFGRATVQKLPDGTRKLTWHCIFGAGLDASSNTVISAVGCPTPATAEKPADAVAFTHVEMRDAGAGIGTKMAPFMRTYTDRLGRSIRTATESFDGAQQPTARKAAIVVQDTVYNDHGLVALQTSPYFLSSGSTTTAGASDRGVTKTEYDALRRPVRTAVADAAGSVSGESFGPYGEPRAAVQTTSYSGLSSTVTNDQGKTRKEERNPLGEVVRVTDATGGQLVRQFDAFGNLSGTKDALQNRVQIKFDLRGRRLALIDPNLGQIDECHDALGQLKYTQNALMRGAAAPGQCPDTALSTTTATAVANWASYAHDVLGRLAHRIEPEYQSFWKYDTYTSGACANGKGKLCEVSTSHGLTKRTYFDTLGRVAGQRADIASGPSFAIALTYNATTGRLAARTFPTGVKVGYRYTTLGMADGLTLATPATVTPLPAVVGSATGAPVNLAAGAVLWQAEVVDAAGRTERQLLNNDITGRANYDPASGRLVGLTAGTGTGTSVLNHTYGWDSLGNLTSRGDSIGDGVTGAVTESFSYGDGLNRLTGYAVSAVNIPGLRRSVQLDYNVVGMLLRKSDVGVYSYPPQGPSAIRPNAVTGVSGAVSMALGYDANGNLITATGGKYRSLTYTSFNLPDSNTGAQGPSGSPKYTWLYDEAHARFKEVHVDGAGTRTTWYLHPDNAGALDFESETAPDGKLSQRHYLSVGGQRIGVMVSTAALPTLTALQTAPTALGSVALAKLEYWHQDHLGSLSATSDHAGAVTARYAYDPFGKRRFADGRYDAMGNLVVDWSPLVNKGTDRGFTGHEHLDDIGLVHMNGRIYDPTLGRFLAADPHVTHPEVLQSYDRYAYVLNNPLNKTDPTGFSDKDVPAKQGSFDRAEEREMRFKLAQGWGIQAVSDAAFAMVDRVISALDAGGGGLVPRGGSSESSGGSGQEGPGKKIVVAIQVGADKAKDVAKAIRDAIPRAALAFVPSGEEITIFVSMAQVAIVEPTPVGEVATATYGAALVGKGVVKSVRTLAAEVSEALAAKGGKGYVDGFRAVSKKEADDIAKHGFRPEPSGRSMNDKWFSETRQGAEQFRKTYPELESVVRTRVPRDVYDRSFKHPNIDNTGPGFCVQCSDLKFLPKP